MSKRINDQRTETENLLTRLRAQREACIANLVRYEEKIKLTSKKLERLKKAQVRSLQKEMAEKAASMLPPLEVIAPKLAEKAAEEDDSIPGFLRRASNLYAIPPAKDGGAHFVTATFHSAPEQLTEAERIATAERRDARIAQEIREKAAARKVEKSRVRVEKMKAKAAGETRKMPLTGRAALAFIKGA